MDDAKNLFIQGIKNLNNFNYLEAKYYFKKSLEIDCNRISTKNNLSLVLILLNQFDDAMILIDDILSKNYNDEFAHFNKGRIFYNFKIFDKAFESFTESLRINNEYSDAFYYKGLVYDIFGDQENAIIFLLKSLEFNKSFIDARLKLFNIYINNLDYVKAEYHVKKLLFYYPEESEFNCLYGKLLYLNDKKNEALYFYNKSLEINNNDPNTLFYIGNYFYDNSNYELAIHHYNLSIKNDKLFFNAYLNKANSLYKLKKYSESLSITDECLNINNKSHSVYALRGAIYSDIKSYEKSIINFNYAIDITPNNATYFYNLGNSYKQLNQLEFAIDSYKKAFLINSNYIKARWAICFASYPIIFEMNDNIEEKTSNLMAELNNLKEFCNSICDIEGLAEAVGSVQPFYLAYQNRNNKNILEIYAKITSNIMNKWGIKNRLILNYKKNNQRKIIIGFISAYFYNHSVWNAITKGIYKKIDKNKFEIITFDLSPFDDSESKEVKIYSDHYYSGFNNLFDISQKILSLNIDVLFYPEIGMDPLTCQVANLRLAPIQVCSWGHPESQELPTIDYIFSSKLFHKNIIDDYDKNTIKLSNLGTYLLKPPTPEYNINKSTYVPIQFLIDNNIKILICPGNTYKYISEFDFIFPIISQSIEKFRFVFFNKNKDLTKFLYERLNKAFEDLNLILSDYVLFVDWLNKDEFHYLMQRSTVCLDTIGFSGFNTALQSIESNLPIVTLQTELIKGNLGNAILKRIGLEELIASNIEEYIRLVIKLANDTHYRKLIISKIKYNKFIIYEDISVINEVEFYLQSWHRNL